MSKKFGFGNGGSEYANNMKYCRKCEIFVDRDRFPSRFCINCGTNYRLSGHKSRKWKYLQVKRI